MSTTFKFFRFFRSHITIGGHQLFVFCLRMKSGLTVSYYLGRFGGIPDSSMSDGLVNRTYQLFPRVDQNSHWVCRYLMQLHVLYWEKRDDDVRSTTHHLPEQYPWLVYVTCLFTWLVYETLGIHTAGENQQVHILCLAHFSLQVLLTLSPKVDRGSTIEHETCYISTSYNSWWRMEVLFRITLNRP